MKKNTQYIKYPYTAQVVTVTTLTLKMASKDPNTADSWEDLDTADSWEDLADEKDKVEPEPIKVEQEPKQIDEPKSKEVRVQRARHFTHVKKDVLRQLIIRVERDLQKHRVPNKIIIFVMSILNMTKRCAKLFPHTNLRNGVHQPCHKGSSVNGYCEPGSLNNIFSAWIQTINGVPIYKVSVKDIELAKRFFNSFIICALQDENARKHLHSPKCGVKRIELVTSQMYAYLNLAFVLLYHRENIEIVVKNDIQHMYTPSKTYII